MSDPIPPLVYDIAIIAVFLDTLGKDSFKDVESLINLLLADN